MSEAFDWAEFASEPIEADTAPPRTTPKPEAPQPGGLIEAWATDLVLDHEMNRPRSRQAHVGPSEVGERCDRRLAMAVANVQQVNYPDPLKAYVGTGLHQMLADAVELRDRGTGRYLSEHRVTYRGVTGSVDLFDRVTGRLIDFKSKSLTKVKRARRQPMEHGYKVQQMIYAAGLIAQGEHVKSVTLLYIPTDGDLSDMYAQTLPVDVSIADEAIDRLECIQNEVADGKPLPDFKAHTSALCGWCPFYSPLTPLSPASCPGATTPTTTVAGEPKHDPTQPKE
jgi:hypothetical protein